jgi:hypothetical protein
MANQIQGEEIPATAAALDSSTAMSWKMLTAATVLVTSP